MSSIRNNSRVKTETFSAFTHSNTRNSRIKTQPAHVSLKSSQIKHWTQGSQLLESKAKKMTGIIGLQQPHFIRIALSSQLKQSGAAKERNKSILNEEQSDNCKYLIVKLLSEGSTGRVFLGRTHQNKKIAIKQVIASRHKHSNELVLLKNINHPNIIQLKDYFFKAQKNRCLLHLVTDYYPFTLYQIIQHRAIQKQNIPIYIGQILRGLDYLHRKGIVHRDLTPQNILVDPNSQRVVIADLGSAKHLKHNELSISYVCARTYRAPELLFGSTRYGCEVDMWSLGCIMGQIANGSPLFKGKTSIQQTLEIMKRLGTPFQSQMTAMNAQFSRSQYQILPKIKSKPWKDIINTRDDALLDLIAKLLVYDPRRRLTPQKALQHPYLLPFNQDNHFQQQVKVQVETGFDDLPASQTKSINLDIESPRSPINQVLKNQKEGLPTQSSNGGYGFQSTRVPSGILKRRLF